ncbi:hypothetical protein PFISCL1PPCAC_14235 [Pristionchus fissidentatus]|uniref:G protein-coupled receptor n=1 Tax=Pristionchus fissidentatus TaxID=1538716 RepID=A0AAV5VU16_9BILA|nr:hypothetical protein PFISCL1PPCAC_14235 [Pristionchus fissidentatus]
MAQNRSYGLQFDENFGIDLALKFQFFYGFVVLPIHPISIFVLIRYSRGLSNVLRAGYLVNQVQMLLHDLWTCFLFRAYPLLPYPIFYCEGLFCKANPSMSMMIEIFFMIHAISLLLFMLMNTHQQILPASSSFRFSPTVRISFVVIIYIALWSNGVAAIIFRENVENAAEIIRSNNLQWLYKRPGGLLVYGGENAMGDFGYEAYTIILSIALIAPARAFLVGTSVGYLKRQNLIGSRTMVLKKRVISALILQTAIVSFLYVYPLLLTILMMRFSVAFLPDFLLIPIRFLVIPLSMLNSLAQFYVQIRKNTMFHQIIVS